MKPDLDHIGILVSDLEHSLKSLQSHGWPTGEIEEFPSEGTKEIDVGPVGATGRLLLIQAVGEGPYRAAMAKRGPGLHHIAISAPDVTEFLAQVSGSGWYLHPKSLATYKKHKTIWLSRPGVPMLVEVVEKISSDKSERDTEAFVSRIEVPLPHDKPLMADSLGVDESIQKSSSQRIFITIGGNRRTLEKFVDIAG